MKEKFYITTTLPYVNAPPHIGFALELVQADVIARSHRLRGAEVVFSTGTDEHGLKIYGAAKEEGKDPQAYVDEYAPKFSKLIDALGVSSTRFIRTTDPHHIRAAQEFWKRCAAAGDVYKKLYKIKYCVGCELEKTDSELEAGRCTIHPNLAIEEIEEENYFFRFSKYQEPLLSLYREHPAFVIPESRLNEIRKFAEGGLRDFSISRLKSKMPWGVPVPGDESHVMYVWFDALVNYISTLGWPEDEKKFKEFWPGVQIAGKDNLRQQSAMWQAMLMSAGLPASRQVLIHGFVTSEGKKMSKSLGNVVDPLPLIQKYGADAVRYYLLREIPAGEDGDFSEKKFKERYNGDLANGLGNLVSRVAAIGGKAFPEEYPADGIITLDIEEVVGDVRKKYEKRMEAFRFHEALEEVWRLVAFADWHVNETKPWAIADNRELQINLAKMAYVITAIADLLELFLPETSLKIRKQISFENDLVQIKKGEVLFPRI